MTPETLRWRVDVPSRVKGGGCWVCEHLCVCVVMGTPADTGCGREHNTSHGRQNRKSAEGGTVHRRV